MTTMKCVTTWLLLGFLALVAICGCKKSDGVSSTDSTDEEEYKDTIFHVDMQYFNFDEVDNLSLFFDSLSKEHGIDGWDQGSSELVEKDVFKCLERIDGYRKGKYEYYPDSLVRNCIDILGHDNAALANHADSIDIGFSEWFLMCTAFYSPDITCLVEMQTPDHCAGILNFGSTYNFTPWWCYVFLKRHKGFEVRRIGGDGTKIDKLFQIVDDDNRLYYLCSNNRSGIEFLQVLFWVRRDSDVLLVAECDNLPVDSWDGFEEVYYNPDQRSWHCCNYNSQSGKLIPISEKPALVLKLDGDESYFTKND